ncbi:lysozyme inhibitor LprI family protein [Acuticoccus mangrovi]|uniref:Lysozyme inhibitor LprI N-terminal domain-containing protein n=1 Tax=Acuticoccus mangrovi TaxID=2796142 RepID=A0A934ME88_9HYPH|nr:hypothetical protein [Acuticoccus mangrovi]MBJ3774118.1 hypothetical protein [Acuticoccus mangrovi]
MYIDSRLRAATLALAMAGVGTSPAMAQSFDCAKASAADEVAVCRSGRLCALDDEMASLYEDVLAHALMGVSGETRDGQREFLEKRAACGADDPCLTALYEARIAELKKTREALGDSPAH